MSYDPEMKYRWIGNFLQVKQNITTHNKTVVKH